MFDCEPGLRLRCFVLDLENIFSNLFSNSVASFERESEIPLNEKRIFINITEQSNRLIRIDYQDTGWGLSDIYKKYPERILEAFETDKKIVGGLDEDGTGMGMWIYCVVFYFLIFTEHRPAQAQSHRKYHSSAFRKS